MSSIILRFLIIIAVVTLCSVFEAVLPAERGHRAAGRAWNMVFVTVFLLLGGLATYGLQSAFPMLYLNASVFTALPALFAIPAYLFVHDFLFYWYHRAEHAWKPLWYVHELHHSEEQLNATSSLRTHWIELPLQHLCITLPASYIVGMSEVVFAIAMLVQTMWLFITHTNMRVSLGPLTRLITGPQLHRIHHSASPVHRDKNFAQYFPLFDVLFGTYYAPARGQIVMTGTRSLPGNVSVLTATLRPFKMWSYGMPQAFRRRRSKVG